MHGQITKRLALHTIFTRYSTIVEVYADKDFSLEMDVASVYILVRDLKTVDTTTVLSMITNLYGQPCSVYFSEEESNMMFEDKKLIWRKGRWYL